MTCSAVNSPARFWLFSTDSSHFLSCSLRTMTKRPSVSLRQSSLSLAVVRQYISVEPDDHEPEKSYLPPGLRVLMTVAQSAALSSGERCSSAGSKPVASSTASSTTPKMGS